MFDHKNDQMIKETEYILHKPNQPDLVSIARIKDAASLEPPSRLINQELQDEGTDESAGYRGLQPFRFCLSLASKDQPS